MGNISRMGGGADVVMGGDNGNDSVTDETGGIIRTTPGTFLTSSVKIKSGRTTQNRVQEKT